MPSKIQINRTFGISQSNIVTNEIGGINGVRRSVAENIEFTHSNIRFKLKHGMPALNLEDCVRNDNDDNGDVLLMMVLVDKCK